MGTRVYNAYILKCSNFSALMVLKEQIRKDILEIQKKEVFKVLLKNISMTIDMKAMGYELYDEYEKIANKGKYLSNAISILKEKFAKKDPYKDFDNAFECDIVFIPYSKTKTILKVCTDNEEYNKYFSENFEDFSYSNGGDKPLDIDKKDWSRRKKFWNKQDGSFSDLGSTCQLHQDIYWAILDLMENKKNFISHQPSLEIRASRIIERMVDLNFARDHKDYDVSKSGWGFVIDYLTNEKPKLMAKELENVKSKLKNKFELEDIYEEWSLKEQKAEI